MEYKQPLFIVRGGRYRDKTFTNTSDATAEMLVRLGYAAAEGDSAAKILHITVVPKEQRIARGDRRRTWPPDVPGRSTCLSALGAAIFAPDFGLAWRAAVLAADCIARSKSISPDMECAAIASELKSIGDGNPFNREALEKLRDRVESFIRICDVDREDPAAAVCAGAYLTVAQAQILMALGRMPDAATPPVPAATDNSDPRTASATDATPGDGVPQGREQPADNGNDIKALVTAANANLNIAADALCGIDADDWAYRIRRECVKRLEVMNSAGNEPDERAQLGNIMHTITQLMGDCIAASPRRTEHKTAHSYLRHARRDVNALYIHHGGTITFTEWEEWK